MKAKTKEYESPKLFEHQMFIEGILCLSGQDNECYGGLPGDDETIF